MNTVELIQQKLALLSPERIEVFDESGKHAGHEGAKGGGGHYRLLIVSAKFAGKPAVMRHRMIYDALGDMMRHDVHALAIEAFTPDEVAITKT